MVDARHTLKKADDSKSAKKTHIIPIYWPQPGIKSHHCGSSKGSKTVLVGNLSGGVEFSDVENFFQCAGEIVKVWFRLDQYQVFRGVGYVEFATAEAAQKAVVELNGKILNDNHVEVQLEDGWLDGGLGVHDTKHSRKVKSYMKGRLNKNPKKRCSALVWQGKKTTFVDEDDD